MRGVFEMLPELVLAIQQFFDYTVFIGKIPAIILVKGETYGK